MIKKAQTLSVKVDNKNKSKTLSKSSHSDVWKSKPYFVEGLMKVSYNGPLSNFKDLTFQKSCVIAGQAYRFKGEQRVHVTKDSVNKYSYQYILKPNSPPSEGKLFKEDFVGTTCDFFVFKSGTEISNMPLTVQITVHFSDRSILLIDNSKIHTR